jgi:hypothetical protein
MAAEGHVVQLDSFDMFYDRIHICMCKSFKTLLTSSASYFSFGKQATRETKMCVEGYNRSNFECVYCDLNNIIEVETVLSKS